MLREDLCSLFLYVVYIKINKFNEKYFCIFGVCFVVRKFVFIKVGMFDE